MMESSPPHTPSRKRARSEELAPSFPEGLPLTPSQKRLRVVQKALEETPPMTSSQEYNNVQLVTPESARTRTKRLQAIEMAVPAFQEPSVSQPKSVSTMHTGGPNIPYNSGTPFHSRYIEPIQYPFRGGNAASLVDIGFDDEEYWGRRTPPPSFPEDGPKFPKGRDNRNHGKPLVDDQNHAVNNVTSP